MPSPGTQSQVTPAHTKHPGSPCPIESLGESLGAAGGGKRALTARAAARFAARLSSFLIWPVSDSASPRRSSSPNCARDDAAVSRQICEVARAACSCKAPSLSRDTPGWRFAEDAHEGFGFRIQGFGFKG